MIINLEKLTKEQLINTLDYLIETFADDEEISSIIYNQLLYQIEGGDK